ncbi:unnamed protein product [Closterium sp. Naga37s-1]|nr:unnamed protein product [Closterium sp. Naga37s-1]
MPSNSVLLPSSSSPPVSFLVTPLHARLADLLLLAAHEPSAALAGVQQRVHGNVPSLVALKAETLACSREAEFAGADVADCHVIARSMTAGGPASVQRMLARLAAAKPLLPSLRGAKDVAPRPLPSVRAGTDVSGGRQEELTFESTQKNVAPRPLPSVRAGTDASGGRQEHVAGNHLQPVLPSLRAENDVPPGPLRAGAEAYCRSGAESNATLTAAEGDALPVPRAGGGEGVDEGVRAGGDDSTAEVCSGRAEGRYRADTAGMPAAAVPQGGEMPVGEVARKEGAGAGVVGGGRLVGLGSASDQAARKQSNERVSGIGGGEGSREEVVDGGEGSGLRKGEGGGGVEGEGGTRAEEEGMDRGKGGNAVERGGAGGGVVEVVFSAAASRTDDVAAVASSSDVASMSSGADVAGARVAVADRAGVRRALTGPAALLAFINDGAEDTAEDASIGAATTGDAQTSISSRLLRLISPPSLLWQSQQPLRKKEGGSSELPNGNRIGEEQRLRLEAWLDK